MKFTIYQPKNPTFRVDSEEINYFFDEYKNVYEGTTEKDKETDGQILENLFRIFNLERPHDFHGHSLSIGDIVVLNKQAYICDVFGWNKINLF